MEDRLTDARRIAQRLLHLYEVYGNAGVDTEDALALARLVADATIPRPITIIEESASPDPEPIF